MGWLDILTLTVPIAVVVIGWLLNERSKRRAEERKGKEERYRNLLDSVYGFYVSTDDEAEARKAKEEYIRQLRLGWLYCPDAVIRKANAFLDTVSTGVRKSDQEKNDAFAAFVIEARKDSLGKDWGRERTKLQVSDYRHWRST